LLRHLRGCGRVARCDRVAVDVVSTDRRFEA
jgi:hypothetical protein